MRAIRRWIVAVGMAGMSFARGNPVELWVIGAAEHRPGGPWAVRADAEHHIPTQGEWMPYRHYDAGVSRAVGRRWIFGANYRYVVMEQPGRFRREHRPHLNAAINFMTGPVRWADRSRLEYRFIEDADDMARYRNRLQIGIPWERRGWTLEPFVADELFVDLTGSRVDQNRLMVGVGIGRPGLFRTDLFGGVRSLNARQGWSELTIIGVSAQVSF